MHFLSKVLLLCSILIFFGCSDFEKNKPTEIYQLEDLTYQSITKNGYGEKFTLLFEFFIVYNPIKDKSVLIKYIDEYNKNSLKANDLLMTETRIRKFYKKTDNLTKNYKESERGWPDPDDTIDLHNDALILIVKWTEFGKSVEYEIPEVYTESLQN